MSKQSEAVMRWRRNTKRKLIYALGGKCCICGYDRCDGALEFHHRDPSEKDFHWGAINGNIRGWATIVAEMKKCVCVCSNCHRELHAGMVDLPLDAQVLNEQLIPSELLFEPATFDSCPVCGKQKLRALRMCSVVCANTRRIKIVDWDKHDVVSLVGDHGSYAAVGELLGVSGAAVARRYKRVISKS